MVTIRTEPVIDESAWHGRDLATNRRWEYELSAQHLDELEAALAQLRGAPAGTFGSGPFERPGLSTLMSAIARELQHGHGFALVHGFPVERYDLPDLERLYWGLCAHLGPARTQNGQAGLIHYVTDGKLKPSQGNRGVGVPRESRLHVDLTDCVSLLCVRQAPDDPPSRVASSTHVYNRFLRERPDDLVRLYQGFQWDRQGEHADHETPTTGYLVPLFSQRDGVVSCRYNRGWINPAAERLGQPLAPAESELLDAFDAYASEGCFEFPFHSGDIQFCNNYTVLHGRAAHAEIPKESDKRILLRIWVDFPQARPFVDEGLIRYGVVRHGLLGWSPEEVTMGQHHAPRARTSEGVPIP